MDPALDAIRLDFDPASLFALNLILAVLMFGVALDLRASDFRAVARSPKGPLVGIATQLLVLPPATFLLVQLIDPIPSVALGMMLIAACPGGNVSNFLVWLARGNAALSVSMTAVTSTAAMLMTPLNLTFWAALDPATRQLLSDIAVDPVLMVVTILLILALPLFAGMWTGSRYPRFAARMRRPMRLVGGVFFLGFIVLAFWRDREYLTLAILPVLGIVAVHNALALALGYGAGRAAGLGERDRRAVTIEVGIQNSGLGLALIFTFFAGLGGMAIVAAWWGTWHIVGGLTLAALWSRRVPAGTPALAD